MNEFEKAGLALVRESIRRGDSCHLCGRCQSGGWSDSAGQRGWEGWEIKNDAGVHLRYLPDLPERLCRCGEEPGNGT